MKKRLLSLFFVLILIVGSITSCKKNTTSNLGGWDTLREIMKMDFSTSSVEYNMKLNIPLETDEEVEQQVYDILKDISIKVDTVIESNEPYKAKMDIYYMIPGSKEYTHVTDCIIDGNAYYINIKDLREMLYSLNNTYISVFAGILVADKEYMQIAISDLESLSKKYSDTTVDLSDYNLDIDVYGMRNIIVDKAIQIFENSAKNVRPEVLTKKDSRYLITLNKENAGQLFTNIINYIESEGDGLLTETIDELSKLKGQNQEVIDALKDWKQAWKDVSKEDWEKSRTQLNNIKDSKDDFDVSIDYDLEGVTGSRKSKVNVKIKGNSIENKKEESLSLFYKYNAKEGKKEKINVPDESITLTDYVEKIINDLTGNSNE